MVNKVNMIKVEKIKEIIIVIIALIIGIESFIVMMGWIFGIQFLTRFFPNGINMKFPTALAFFLCAIALYLIFLIIRYEHELATVILPGIISIIFLIMGAMLVAGISGLDTGVENLFLSGQGSIYSTGSGIPSYLTIITFILFSFACIASLFNYNFRLITIKIFGFAISAIGLIVIIGYLLSVPALYLKFDSLIPVALNTAVCFFLLGFGLFIISKIETKNEN